MKRWILIAAMAGATAGCRDHVHTSLWEQIRQLSDERTELRLENEQLRQENAAMSDQLETLAAIDGDVRTAALVVPRTIRIGRHSGVYDRTADGKPVSLVVHLEPLDAQQDAVKAAGRVDVELWDLAAAPQTARIGAWHVGAEDLNTMWGRGLTGSYYRLTFPLEGVLNDGTKEWTLRVRFTEYLTGRILTDQKVLTR